MPVTTLAFADNLFDQIIGDIFEGHRRLVLAILAGTQCLDTGLTAFDFIFADQNGKRSAAFIRTFHLRLETAAGIRPHFQLLKRLPKFVEKGRPQAALFGILTYGCPALR